MSISTPGPKDKYSICYTYYHRIEKTKILKMAIIEPFGRHYIGCENRLEENGFADESELTAIKELISIPRKGRKK